MEAATHIRFIIYNPHQFSFCVNPGFKLVGHKDISYICNPLFIIHTKHKYIITVNITLIQMVLFLSLLMLLMKKMKKY